MPYLIRILSVCRIPSLECNGEEIIPFKTTLLRLQDSTTLSTLAVTPYWTSLKQSKPETILLNVNIPKRLKKKKETKQNQSKAHLSENVSINSM